MKRRLSILMMLCLLLSCLLPMAASAQSDAEETPAWAALSYRSLTGEGEEPAAEVPMTPTQRAQITDSVEILFDTELSVVELTYQTQPVDPGYTITKAGTYTFKVFEKVNYIPGGNNKNYVNYTVEYAPNVIVKNGEEETRLAGGAVYQYHPTLICDNAVKIEVRQNVNKIEYASGAAWPTADKFPQFGEFAIDIYGYNNSNGSSVIKTYVFKIYPCVASQDFDWETGQHTLKITTGKFEGVSYLLDGKETLADNTTKTVTAVGEHTLDILLNGERVDPSLYRYYGMPTAEDLALRIVLELDTDVWDMPRTLNFSRWNANIELNGEPVSGDILIDSHGEHVLRVVDDEGNEIENCFLISVGGSEATVESELTVTFDNPHYVYVIFIIVPAALLLAAAVGFLILRRKIV